MKKVVSGSAFLLSACLLSMPSMAAGWSYTGSHGAEHWGELDPSFETCKEGRNQSPINLSQMIEAELPSLHLAYSVGGDEVVNNGHTIQVNFPAGNEMKVAGRSFELKQVHFHSPSENNIEGRSYPMEGHFVHADEAGNLAVVAVMYKVAEQSTELEKAWSIMPQKAGESAALSAQLQASALLPTQHDYYRFNGSLTTPPCSEGVNWFVMKYYQTVSLAQVKQFTEVVGEVSNRPVQPVNARVILK